VHALVVKVSVRDREAAQRALNREVVPRVSEAPGFQTGYWMWKDTTGLAMVIFDSEDAASEGADRVRVMVDEAELPVQVEDVEVREVIAHA
jgi:hypothetical protein